MNCPNCDKPITETEKFCRHCGYTLINPSKIQTSNPAVNNSTGLIRWGWVLIGMIPAAILTYSIVRFISVSIGSENGIFSTIMNTLIFLVGALGVILFPVGIILVSLGYSRRRNNKKIV